MGVYAQENQRRHGRPSGAVGRKTLQVVLIQKLGSNGVSRVRHCRTPGLCQNDKQLDVNELPGLLNDWIVNNIGSDAIDREKNLANLPVSPLFIVFTFFNNQLKFDTTNDDKEDISYKWNTRFNRFFEQELVTVNHDWHKSWTSSNPLFRNFYLLRDYKYSVDTFTGFEEVGTETGIQLNRVEFLDRIKQSFVQHEFVQKHFEKPLV